MEESLKIEDRPEVYPREWKTLLSRPDLLPEDYQSEDKFSVMTYNILADQCIKEGEYLYLPEERRYMPWRHQHMMLEVAAFCPDILCLQEVQGLHYQNCLKPDLSVLGYKGVFHQRRDDQGLAVFFRGQVFELMGQKHCVLSSLAETPLQVSDLEYTEMDAVRQFVSEWPDAALLVKLHHMPTGQVLCVANIHVRWSNLEYPGLQALQPANTTSYCQGNTSLIQPIFNHVYILSSYSG